MALQGKIFPTRYFKHFDIARSSRSSSSSHTSSFFETNDGINMVWNCTVKPCKHPNTGKDAYSIDVKVHVCDRKLEVIVCLEIRSLRDKAYSTSTRGLTVSGQKIGRTRYIPQDGLGKHLFVVIDMTIVGEPVDDEPMVPNQPQFISCLASMLYSGKHSDLKISVGKEEFAAHKAMLAARSPVFAAMFDHEFQECNQNRVTITDVEPKVFRVMLEFIYTNEVADLDLLAYDLLAVADKYAIDELKSMCEASLSRNIRIETATQYFVVADLYRCKYLRQRSLDFICKYPAVLRTEAWMQMWPTRPDLVNEILCKVMGKK